MPSEAPQAIRPDIRGPGAQLFLWADRGGFPDEVLLDGPAGSAKSFSILCFLIYVATRWQGCRILIVRQTRASITESACVTIEKIVPSNHPMLEGPGKEHRHSYSIGRSEIVLGSLENPDRLYSTEWDIVYFQEAREGTRDAWERFGRSLRNHVTPFQTIIGDTNPDHPGHWLNQRCLDGKTVRLLARHVDNPAYWDEERQEWTHEGRTYIERLSRMTGVRRRRLYLGEWCSSEGAIWEEFDPARHMVTLERDENGWVTQAQRDKLGITAYYAGVDWGFSAPGSLLVFGYARTKKLYLVAEVYRTAQQISWWADRFYELNKHYDIETAFCDPSRPDGIEAFNVRIGAPKDGPGAVAVEGNNAIFQGLDAVRRRFSTVDGGPFLFFDKKPIYGGIDIEMRDASQPCSLVEEIPAFVYQRKSTDADVAEEKSKDKPDPRCADHACDALRYLCMGLEFTDPHTKPIDKWPSKSFGSILGHDKVGGRTLDKQLLISHEWDQSAGYD